MNNATAGQIAARIVLCVASLATAAFHLVLVSWARSMAAMGPATSSHTWHVTWDDYGAYAICFTATAALPCLRRLLGPISAAIMALTCVYGCYLFIGFPFAGFVYIFGASVWFTCLGLTMGRGRAPDDRQRGFPLD